MQLSKIISTRIESVGSLARRIIKVTRFGNADTMEPWQANNFGIDSNPIAGMVAVYSSTTENGKNVIIGYLNKNQLANSGETRLFSVDANGNLQTYIWLDNTGNILLGGNSDNSVRYSPMAATIQEIQDDIKKIKQVFSATWTPVANDGGAALKVAAATWAATPLTKDISNSKINNIKTP